MPAQSPCRVIVDLKRPVDVRAFHSAYCHPGEIAKRDVRQSIEGRARQTHETQGFFERLSVEREVAARSIGRVSQAEFVHNARSNGVVVRDHQGTVLAGVGGGWQQKTVGPKRRPILPTEASED